MANEPIDEEPRWPAMIAAVAAGLLYVVLPKQLTIVPSLWVLGGVLALQAIIFAAKRLGLHRLNEIFAYIELGLLTAAMIVSLGLLIRALPSRKETPVEMLVSAASLWTTNVLVFACWYWRLDAGGPNQRDRRAEHSDGAFLFPQMVMDEGLKEKLGEQDWRPGFVDYLFLAFNSSTAFSPTDAPVLSRWAKCVMMVQSLISLATIAVLAARAINIL